MAEAFDFSGLWHSAYTYVNKSEPKGGVSEHDVKLYKTGNQLVMQSVPNEEGSYLVIRVTQDDNILTGTWQEQSSPTGTYKGQTYYGAVQFLVEKDGHIRGKSVLFNQEMEIITSDWELTRISSSDDSSAS